jgi:tRNA-splicing ligase RtcB
MGQPADHIIDAEGKIHAWVKGVPVEESAQKQLREVAALPFVKRVAVMPDVHWGRGATVGSVIATKGAIIPAAVGVDLGCGMLAARTTLTAEDLPDTLADLRARIERAVPHGRTNNGGPGDRGAWGDAPKDVIDRLDGVLLRRLVGILEKYPKLVRTGTGTVRALAHLGTLGTGNHFIEVCLDQDRRVWVMLHSGSRGIGNSIGSFFIEKAQEEMERWYINLPNRDLAYIPEGSTYFKDYVEAVEWAQEYAAESRKLMLMATLKAMRASNLPEFAIDGQIVNCHHNYISRENHLGENVIVTRKGAVSAREGQMGIIPGSMGARSYIVRGKGNRDALTSCSHGAGRAMSRTEARRRFTVEDHLRATEGVECLKDESVLDETPAAYKDIDAVMAAQESLVDPVFTLKQVLCVKGGEKGEKHR